MTRALLAILCSVVSISCRGDAERLPPPLPQDGTALPYSQVLTRLAAQIETAKEEHFLNHWDAVVDSTMGLEQSSTYVLKSPDLPVFQRAKIEKASSQMQSDILKLRTAARKKEQFEALEIIRRIHNQIRDLQDLH